MRKQKIILIMLIATITLASIELIDLTSAQRITTFTGSGDQTTEYFTVPTKEWQISWEYATYSPDHAAFAIIVYPKGETALYTDLISVEGANPPLFSYLNDPSTKNGTNYEHQGNGDYYFKILAANIDAYRITVIQGQADPASTLTPTPTVPEYSTYTVLIVIVAVVSLASIMLFKQRKN